MLFPVNSRSSHDYGNSRERVNIGSFVAVLNQIGRHHMSSVRFSKMRKEAFHLSLVQRISSSQDVSLGGMTLK